MKRIIGFFIFAITLLTACTPNVITPQSSIKQSKTTNISFTSTPKIISTATSTSAPTLAPSLTPTSIPQVISEENIQNLKVFNELGKGSFYQWEIGNVAWSPNGKILAKPTTAGIILIHTAKMEEEALNTGPAKSVVFSPDGKYIVTSNGIVWDIEKREAINRLTVTDIYGGNFVAFSNDGQSVFINSDSQHLLRLDPISSEIKQTIILENGISSGAISNDGTIIALVDEDQKIVRLYDAIKGKKFNGSDYIRYQDKIRQVVFSPDGNMLAITGFEKSPVKLWDSHKGTLIKNLEGDFEWSYGISFSPDGKNVIASSYAKPIRFWDVESGKVNHSIERTGDLISFSPDGSKIALSNLWNNSVSILNASSEEEIAEIKGFIGIYGFNFTNDPSKIYSSYSQNSDKYCLWNYENGTSKVNDSGIQGTIIAMNSNGIAAIATENRLIQLGNINNRIILCNTNSFYQWSAEISPDGHFALLSAEGGVSNGIGSKRVLWDIDKCQIVNYLSDFLGNFTFENKLISINKSGKLIIQSINSNDVISTIQLEKFDKYTEYIGISPDANLLVGIENERGSTKSGVISFWRMSDGKLIHTIELQPHSQAEAPVFSPDGCALAINIDGKIIVYKIVN